MSRELSTSYSAIRSRKSIARLKVQTIEAYGGQCECCGEEKTEFLTIDHKGGGGAKHRKLNGRSGHPFYSWLRKRGWPKTVDVDGHTIQLRLLCWNCNASFGYFGYCPHESPEKTLERFPIRQPSLFHFIKEVSVVEH